MSERGARVPVVERVLGYDTIQTPAGPGFVAFGEAGVVVVHLGGERAFRRVVAARIDAVLERRAMPAASAARLRAAMHAGDGDGVDWESIPGFQRRVLRAAARIPRGSVQSYGWVAAAIGEPRAARAVGTAMATNPVPFLVPCHRVIRADGTLGGYGIGGTAMKRRLLRAEGTLL